MKISINRQPKKGPWGGGSKFVESMSSFLENLDHNVIYDLNDPNIDIILMIDPRPNNECYGVNEIYKYKHYNPKVKVLHRINECDARKNTNFMDNILIQSANFADKVIFISSWLRDYFSKKGMNVENSSIIYNGCNTSHFFPPERKIQSDKIKLVTHHWSDNWLKGHDLYQFIDENIVGENYEFTYVGRYCKEYTPKKTKIIPPLWGPALAEEIKKHDIYVTASRFEPCGMHHIEGAACGLPVIYHKDGGGINELCKLHGEAYENFDNFKEKLFLVSKNIKKYASKIDYKNLDIQLCCEKFYNEIINLTAG